MRLEEICELLALNVEISLNQQDMAGLEKNLQLARKADDFEFFAIVQKDPETGKNSVLVSNPDKINPDLVLKPDTNEFLIRKNPVKTNLLDGYVLIATSQEKMEERILLLDNTLFVLMVSVLFLFLLVFLYFARLLAQPVMYLTGIANELTDGNFDIPIEERSRASEILNLNRALVKLRLALKDAKSRNDNFNRKLEEEIRLRTQDLEEAGQRLLEAQEVANLGNYELDLNSGNWQASETIHRILQIPDNFPHIESSWQAFLPKDEQQKLKALFVKSQKTGLAFQLDICIQKGSDEKEEKWISISGRPMAFGAENSGLFRGTIQDISVRKRIENEVRKLSLVAEKTSNCVIITDVNRRIIWVNESTVKTTGYSREEILGNTPSMFQFDKTSKETISYIRTRLSKLEEVNAEILNIGKDGREYWLQINIVPLKDQENRHIGFMAVESDVTERVKFEQDLKRSEENYRNILENASELIFSLDLKGRLTWANRAWREKLAMGERNISGMDLFPFLDENTRTGYQQIMPVLNSGELASGLEFTFLSADGTTLIMEGRAIPLFEGEEIAGSQFYFHDLTSIRKAENALKQLLDLTRRQNERLRNFTHIVSHNLRSHGSNLDGLIKLLNHEMPDFNENIFYRNFEKAVDNLMDVIQNLSEVALIHTDQDKDFEAVNLGNAIDKAIATVFGLAKNAGVGVESHIQDEVWVVADPGYLDSIILNLLTNAIKYRSSERPSLVRISVETGEGPFLRMDVEDNGLGIDLERQGRKMFGMFKTFHNHPDARGVGLFLTKNQVEAMGGRIEVNSQVNKGSVFSVFLRITTAPEI